MPLESGRRLGPYEIIAPAGAGGMGEVYKAKDTRLARTVAIKILPEHLSADPDLKKRFDQEARTISKLNHPRICTLHDIGSEDEVDFLVMEYLEGETLGERLKRGPLRLDEALTYARQIADALDKAHWRGVVHRDLKPGNIMLTKDGVKLLDFGLAKLQAKAIDPALSALPTQDQPLTPKGAIVGTLHYMAPEQLEGRDVDARADLFSLGAVIYEMVTGKKAFQGTSPASVITAVMSATPPAMSELKPITPAALERLVTSCLEKDRDFRWQSAGDLARGLSWLAEDNQPPAEKSSSRLLPSMTALLALSSVMLLILLLVRPDNAPELVHFTIVPPEGASFASLRFGARPAVSPDGNRIAFVVQRGGSSWLAVRDLRVGETDVLTEANGTSTPVWSPDGESLLYSNGKKLMQIDVSSGAPRVVNEHGMFLVTGIAWSTNGAVLMNETGGTIRRVDGDGEFSTTLDEDELSHTSPYFLPDGKHFLFYVPSQQSVYLAMLGSETRSFVRSADSGAIYVNPGYLLFLDGETLMAQRFSLSNGRVEGEAVALAHGFTPSIFGHTAFSASSDVLAFGSGSSEMRLEWFDRTGTSLGQMGEPADYRTVALSPSGRRAIVGASGALWTIDLDRGGIATRLSPDGILATDPVWAPDETAVVTSAFQSDSADLYRLSMAANSEPQLLLSSERHLWGDQWLAADDQLTFHDTYQVSLLPMSGGEPRVLLSQDGLDEPHRSPDGKWLAFSAEESGRLEVYVERLDTMERSRVSTEGGGMPRWRGDGTELFFLSGDGTPMVVDFDPVLGVRGVPRALFDSPIRVLDPTLDQWDVHPSGERFLFLVPTGTEQPIRVILNWQSLLDED